MTNMFKNTVLKAGCKKWFKILNGLNDGLKLV